jgi:hypothetical protein
MTTASTQNIRLMIAGQIEDTRQTLKGVYGCQASVSDQDHLQQIGLLTRVLSGWGTCATGIRRGKVARPRVISRTWLQLMLGTLQFGVARASGSDIRSG